MDDRTFAYLELSGDLLFGKIPPKKRAYYVDGALELGREQARCFQGKELETLYREHGIAIIYQKEAPSAFGVHLRAQSVMGKKEKRVELYRSSIEGLARYSSYGTEENISEALALSMHLAHEFFHYLEFAQGKSAAECLEPVTLTRLFGFTRTGHIQKCSEIAAHAFAKELLGLPYLPNAYDYFYLIHTGKLTEEEFRNTLTGVDI